MTPCFSHRARPRCGLSHFPPCGICYFWPNICSSQPWSHRAAINDGRKRALPRVRVPAPRAPISKERRVYRPRLAATASEPVRAPAPPGGPAAVSVRGTYVSGLTHRRPHPGYVLRVGGPETLGSIEVLPGG